jgi:hypothetical protein
LKKSGWWPPLSEPLGRVDGWGVPGVREPTFWRSDRARASAEAGTVKRQLEPVRTFATLGGVFGLIKSRELASWIVVGVKKNRFGSRVAELHLLQVRGTRERRRDGTEAVGDSPRRFKNWSSVVTAVSERWASDWRATRRRRPHVSLWNVDSFVHSLARALSLSRTLALSLLFF